jgi:tripartite-type tricarboxylate transporter receptor subunit TctC
MIVPFPPGGVADTVARPVAEAMSRDLKQPVVVENKAGAGGGIGMALVAKAKPDGYTILLSLASLTVLPEADKILGRSPMYQLDQLKPIARFTADPTVFVVRQRLWKTRRTSSTMRAPTRQKCGRNYGTMHADEMFAGGGRQDGPLIPAPRPSSVSGQPGPRTGHQASLHRAADQGRQVRAAQWGNERLVSLPDVPGLKSPAPTSNTRNGPAADTPAPVVQRLREAAKAAANDPRVKEVLLTAGSPVLYLDAPEFQRYVDADAAKMADVVKRIGKVE